MNPRNSIKEQQNFTKLMLNKVENQKQIAAKTLDKVNKLMEKDQVHDVKLADQKQAKNIEDIQKDFRELKEVVSPEKKTSHVKTESSQKAILDEAVKESNKMVRLSEDAKQTEMRVPSRKVEDLVQLMKKNPTDNVKAGTLLENAASIAQAIEEDTKHKFKTAKISEDVAVKQNDVGGSGAGTDVDLKNSTHTHTSLASLLEREEEEEENDTNQESKGKAYVEEKRKELIEEVKLTKKVQQVVAQNKRQAQIKAKKQASTKKVNKLRAKFNKH